MFQIPMFIIYRIHIAYDLIKTCGKAWNAFVPLSAGMLPGACAVMGLLRSQSCVSPPPAQNIAVPTQAQPAGARLLPCPSPALTEVFLRVCILLSFRKHNENEDPSYARLLP